MDSFVLKGRPNNTPCGSKVFFEKLAKINPTRLHQQARSAPQDDWEMAILPWQFSKLPSRDFEEMSLEEQIAYKLLMVNLLDITSANLAKRKQAVIEMYRWINNDARFATPPSNDGFEYTYQYWTEVLGVDAGYMTRKIKPFLARCVKEMKGVNL